ncbi:MAG: LysM peptidoglycan-binding domain-containing protein [Pseudobdellovibrionaceae bacterium]
MVIVSLLAGIACQSQEKLDALSLVQTLKEAPQRVPANEQKQMPQALTKKDVALKAVLESNNDLEKARTKVREAVKVWAKENPAEARRLFLSVYPTHRITVDQLKDKETLAPQIKQKVEASGHYDWIQHLVLVGETLQRISQKHYFTTRRWTDIYLLNYEKIVDYNRLQPGIELSLAQKKQVPLLRQSESQ